MTINVYPCPFCMTENVEIDEIDIGRFAVCCQECEATGPISNTSAEDAIARWNCAGDGDGAWDNQIGRLD